MDRRRCLQLLSAGLPIALAGCTDSLQTFEQTEKATTESAHSVTVNLIQVTFQSMTTYDSLRYYDPSSESLKLLRPEGEEWVQVSLYVRNLGGDETYGPPPGRFQLLTDEGPVDRLATLPKIDRENLRLRNNSEIFCMGGYPHGDLISPDRTAILCLLFDSPPRSGNKVVWNSRAGKKTVTPLNPPK